MEELQHHGIRGQKWGVRRYQNKDGSLTSAGRKRQKRQLSDDAKEAKNLKKKRIGELSNAELRKVNERKNLERNYKQLNPNAIKKGLIIVGATTAAMGTVISFKNNSKQIIDMGKNIVNNVKYKQMRLF